jgi:hypothetical protein
LEVPDLADVPTSKKGESFIVDVLIRQVPALHPGVLESELEAAPMKFDAWTWDHVGDFVVGHLAELEDVLGFETRTTTVGAAILVDTHSSGN